MESSTRPDEQSAPSERKSAALRFARRVHLGQHRKQTGEQFVEHPIAVADLLVAAGHDGPVVVAAYLHDVVEKTSVEIEEIRERFGSDVAGLVECLSEDPDIAGYAERKRQLRDTILDSGSDAVLIYAADRVANIRDWRAVAPAKRRDCAERLGTTLEERLELWEEDLDRMRELDPETPFLVEIEADLAALRSGEPALQAS